MAEPKPVKTFAKETFVLNKETSRLHIFAAGASKSLCSYFNLEIASVVPNPVLQGRAYKGKLVDPCTRCRRKADAIGLLDGGRDAAGGPGSSSSEASSEASD